MTDSQPPFILPGGVSLIIISGMSGAGKISAMRTLEDMGCFCADNLPPSIIPTFFHLCRQSDIADTGVAIVSDVRSGASVEDFSDAMRTLTAQGIAHELLYIDCNTDTLIRRFKEVRRAPPLQTTGLTMEEAVEEERRRLSSIREIADRVIDTSDLTLSEFKKRLVSDLAGRELPDAPHLHIVSFGFKYGLPKDLDFAFDVRFLPNPFYNPKMKHKTGQDEDVYNFVMASPSADPVFKHICELLGSVLDAFVDKGRNNITVGIGCTGGRHRSTAVASRLHRHFEQRGIQCELSHRDIAKP